MTGETFLLKFQCQLTLILLSISTCSYAQHEADNWFFGRSVGISFASGTPKPLYGSPIKQTEGTAVASDPKSGRLYFYTDGVTAWNSKHEVLFDGEGLLGSFTSAQSALILPVPGRSNLFYLFTTRSYAEKQGSLNYSIVDMTLADGNGGIVSGSKNIRLEKYGSEKLTAIPHLNKRDFWLISHRWDSDIFLIYEITPLGISSVKEINIGTIHRKAIEGDNHFIGEELGMLKASPNGKLLAAAVYGKQRPFELYDFDAGNGTLSNYRSLGDFTAQYSLSFSPDNSKLYLSLFSDEGSYQFDLNDLEKPPIPIISPDTINHNSTYVGGSMQLGPDRKLYMACLDREGLLVIESPDKKVTNEQVHELRLELKGGKIYQGLPNFLQSTFNTSPIEPYQPETEDCGSDLLIYPNPIIGEKIYIQMDSSSWRPNCKINRLKVYTVAGTLYFTKEKSINENFEININIWPSGVYLLVFEYERKRVVKSVIKI